MSVWQDCLDAIYEDDEFAIDILFTSRVNGQSQTLRALPDLADGTEQGRGSGRSFVVARNVLRIRSSEFAAKFAGDPAKQDRVRLNGSDLTVVNAPEHADPRQLEWRLDCAV